MLHIFLFTLIHQIEPGTYTWLNLNGRWEQHSLECREDLSALKEEKITGTLEFTQNRVVSTRKFVNCELKETMKINSVDGSIVSLQIEDLRTSGCQMSDVRMLNLDRPFDDETLNLNKPFKLIEIIQRGDYLQLKSSNGACFYAVKK